MTIIYRIDSVTSENNYPKLAILLLEPRKKESIVFYRNKYWNIPIQSLCQRVATNVGI